MTTTPRSGNRQFVYIACVLALAAGAIIWGFRKVEQRRMELSELALMNVQQMVQVRLDCFFKELVEDLREEAAAVDLPDSALLYERWFPLLDSHWPIVAIRLADETGNELAMLRNGTEYILSRVATGSKDGPPIRVAYAGERGHPMTRGPWLHDQDHDPRERVWFSKALEDTRNEPIWTLNAVDPLRTPLLQLSYLIRAHRPTEPYRIIQFTVDVTRSPWLDTHRSSDLRPGMLLVNDQGSSLLHMDTTSDQHGIVADERAALAAWLAHKTSGPFTIQVNGESRLAQVREYVLHGQPLLLGVVIDPAGLSPWLGPERTALVIAAILLTALTALLLWAWNRKRLSDERIRKQAKRNRSQELKLAKALGEREVLNREVHHRVKNNLQVVSSLLNLQATRLDDDAVKAEFLRGKRRIDTIALVHHKLYDLSDLRNVDLGRFFQGLVKALADLYAPQSKAVSHEIDTDGIKADQDTAIELGIILCELVGNTYQHAFPYATGGHVEIKVRAVDGDLHRLTVKDNGRGLTEGSNQGAGKLGLEIVEALSDQLDGSFHIQTDPGVQFEVLFRMQRSSAVLITEHGSEPLE
ncbi:MAG: sensor histidine kinase [Flavobacteriales bacterium]|nr:MAG: sensor histidine kinase [Flavobacteriales bacterium]